jgi:hypothetical protein
MAASSSVMKYVPVESGKLGMNQKLTRATKILTAPGRTISYVGCNVKFEDIPSRSKNHFQARRFATPSMLVKIPAAKRPESACEMVFPACQIPILKGDSCLVYQEEVMSDTAGTNGPSVKPMRKRQRQKPHPAVTAGIQIVTHDQTSMQLGGRIRGVPLARMTLAGI